MFVVYSPASSTYSHCIGTFRVPGEMLIGHKMLTLLEVLWVSLGDYWSCLCMLAPTIPILTTHMYIQPPADGI